MHKERKVVWVYPSEDKTRCPVRIIDKYMSLLPPVRDGKKDNFYLRSLNRYTPAQWYGEQVVGLNTLRKMMKQITENSNIQGFFTNHSLCRSGITRLFQAGVDRKIVKEFSGHASDTVDKYQITSDQQHAELSSIIAGQSKGQNKEQDSVENDEKFCNIEVSVSNLSTGDQQGCSCSRQNVKISDTEDLGKFVMDLLKAKKANKTTIKLQIEFDN